MLHRAKSSWIQADAIGAAKAFNWSWESSAFYPSRRQEVDQDYKEAYSIAMSGTHSWPNPITIILNPLQKNQQPSCFLSSQPS